MANYNLPLVLKLIEEFNNVLGTTNNRHEDFGSGVHPYHYSDLYFQPTAVGQLHYPLGGLNTNFIGRRQRNNAAATAGKYPVPSTLGEDGFQVCVNVEQFKPNELTVKTVHNDVIVEGKHEEREDEHGYISRHFVRRYILPKGYDPNQVISTLSSDGILTIQAPKPRSDEGGNNERIITIQQTGPAHLSVKENKQEEKSAIEECTADGEDKKE